MLVQFCSFGLLLNTMLVRVNTVEVKRPHLNETLISGFMEIYLAILNSMVHVIMYTYYLLTAFKIWEKYMKLFKPILTSIQLVR